MDEHAGSRVGTLVRPLVVAAFIAYMAALGTATPALGQAGFSCSVVPDPDGGGSVTVSWNDIGANGYDVIEDNQPKRWTTQTSTTDSTPGTDYRIIAFGNGTNWTTASCTNPNPNRGGGPPVGPVTVLAAGDIGECGGYHVPFVGDLVEQRTDALWLALGDIAYPDGTATDFANCYDPYYRNARDRTIPVVGNHEYYTSGAAGYVDYFNRGAYAGPGAGNRLYYSVDIGNWHLIVLNGECWRVGGCGTGGAQYRWLQSDLAANDRPCIAVAWHHAYYTSSSRSGDTTHMRDYYDLLDREGADILLTGHAHNYERFHRMNAFGQVRSDGIRSFVIGTGGAYQRGFEFVHNGSVVRNSGTWGVLELTLADGSYDWEFIRTTGPNFADTGSGTC